MYDVCMECRNLGSNERCFFLLLHVRIDFCDWLGVVRCLDVVHMTIQSTCGVHGNIYISRSPFLCVHSRRSAWNESRLGLELDPVSHP